MSVNWPKIPVADLCDSIVDCVNRTAPKVDGPTPFKMIRTTNVRNGRIDTRNVNYVDKETFLRWTRRQLPRKGDVILTREAPLGEVGILRNDDQVFLGQRLVSYRADPSLIDPDFLLYSLLGKDLQGQIRALGSGSTVEHMRVPDSKRLMVATPPLEIQKKIAKTLSEYDDLIEINKRRIAILEEMARRLFNEWFVHFRYPGHENDALVDSLLGPIPENWAVGRFDEVVILQRGFDLPTRLRKEGPHPVIAASGVHGNHSEPKVAGPGVITGRSGSIGIVNYVEEDYWPLNTTLWVKEFRLGSVLHAYHLLKSIDLNSVASGAAVPTLNRNHVHSKPVVIPPQDLIQKFESIATSLKKAINNYQTTSRNLCDQRDLLLPRLISGEIDVGERKLESVGAAAE